LRACGRQDCRSDLWGYVISKLTKSVLRAMSVFEGAVAIPAVVLLRQFLTHRSLRSISSQEDEPDATEHHDRGDDHAHGDGLG